MDNLPYGIDWYSSLREEIQAEIRDSMRVVRLDKGEFLYKCGDSSDSLYRLFSGFLRVQSSDANGNQLLFSLVGPGSSFGELSFFNRSPRYMDVIAVTEVRLGVLRRPDVECLIRCYPEIYPALVSALCDFAYELYQRIEDAAILTLRQRVAKLFIFIAKHDGMNKTSSGVINLPITQQNIGDMLGVTRHSVQKELKMWQEENIVEKKLGLWVIKNYDKLEKLACGGNI